MGIYGIFLIMGTAGVISSAVWGFKGTVVSPVLFWTTPVLTPQKASTKQTRLGNLCTGLIQSTEICR